jgi:hypothetical protein
MYSFSQLLVIRIQTYFKQKYGLVISDETAQEYLKSYALMFEVFAESGSGMSPPEALKSSGGGDHPASET